MDIPLKFESKIGLNNVENQPELFIRIGSSLTHTQRQGKTTFYKSFNKKIFRLGICK